MSCAATCVALLVVEIGFRFLKPKADPKWSDRPYAYFLAERPAGDKSGILPPKAPNTFRVGVVGDSFTFGPHLQVEDTFPKRMETWLNLNPQAPKVEVLNRGVSGFSTFDEIALAERVIIQEQADLLVLEVTLNDALLHPLDQKTRHELFGASYQKWRIFQLWSSLGYLAGRLHATATYHRYIDYHRRPFFERETQERFKTGIRTMAELAKRRGVPMVAIIFPLFDFPFNAKYPFVDVHQLVGRVLTEYGVSYVDLQHAYDGVPHQHLQVIPGGDSHPNEIAHRIAAERLLAFLASKKLLPEAALPTRILSRRKDIRSKRIERDNAWSRGLKPLRARS